MVKIRSIEYGLYPRSEHDQSAIVYGPVMGSLIFRAALFIMNLSSRDVGYAKLKNMVDAVKQIRKEY